RRGGVPHRIGRPRGADPPAHRPDSRHGLAPLRRAHRRTGPPPRRPARGRRRRHGPLPGALPPPARLRGDVRRPGAPPGGGRPRPDGAEPPHGPAPPPRPGRSGRRGGAAIAGGDPLSGATDALPTISLIVTCYNQARWVERALDSVAAQTLAPQQLIVADDASTDDSAERIRRWLGAHRPDATFVHHRANTGLPRMLNEVVPLADQDLLAILAADDEMVPERLERQARRLAAAPPSVGLVYADMELMDADGHDLGIRYYDYGPTPVEGDAFEAMLEASVPASPTVMMRRSVLDAVGPFDESFVFEDWDMWLRLSRHVEFAFVPEPLIRYRRIDGSLSRSEAY